MGEACAETARGSRARRVRSVPLVERCPGARRVDWVSLCLWCLVVSEWCLVTWALGSLSGDQAQHV